MCRHYLRGIHFELVTVSKVVAALIKKDIPSRRQNLLVRLFEFDFTVTHRKGELNRNADFFSRWAAHKEWQEDKLLKACYTEAFVSDKASEHVYHLKFLAGDIQAIADHKEEELKEGDGELDSAVLRRTLAEEQRKEPKLMKIIQHLETKRQVQLGLADDNTQPDPMVSMSARHWRGSLAGVGATGQQMDGRRRTCTGSWRPTSRVRTEG